MALETGTYISDLVSANPAGTDTLDKADDHLRLIKSTVKATFPNITGAVTPTHTELNFVDGVTSAIQTQLDAKSVNSIASVHTALQIELGHATDTTITRSAAGVIAVEGGVVPLENRANTFTQDQTINKATSAQLVNVSGTVTTIYSSYSALGGLLGTTSNHSLLLQTNNTERMRIDSSGNVGIGTTSPSSYGKLAVLDGDVYVGKTTGIASLAASSSSVTANLSANSAGVATVGTQTNHPFWLMANNTVRATLDTSGSLLLVSSGGLGYGTGSGGTVTQVTSRTTGVTLNKTNGAITLFTAAGSATAATFTVTNSTVAATDTVVVSVKSGTNVYLAYVTAVAAGSFNITFQTTGGTASDAPVFNFAVIKAVTA